MFKTYKEAEKYFNNMRDEDEMLFRMAISHLLDVGMRNLDEESIAETCEEIRAHDDSRSLISNDMLIAIVETAGKIAKVNQIYILKYIGKIKYTV